MVKTLPARITELYCHVFIKPCERKVIGKTFSYRSPYFPLQKSKKIKIEIC